ncbi:hypothetical protein KR074_012431 [Drosophila pseudoananassae]|nr:hypothetical protein KR074_012431 [Drosophila pseudoananassae]
MDGSGDNEEWDQLRILEANRDGLAVPSNVLVVTQDEIEAATPPIVGQNPAPSWEEILAAVDARLNDPQVTAVFVPLRNETLTSLYRNDDSLNTDDSGIED